MGARCDFAGGPLCACVRVCVCAGIFSKGSGPECISVQGTKYIGDGVTCLLCAYPAARPLGRYRVVNSLVSLKTVPPAAVDGRCVGGQH